MYLNNQMEQGYGTRCYWLGTSSDFMGLSCSAYIPEICKSYMAVHSKWRQKKKKKKWNKKNTEEYRQIPLWPPEGTAVTAPSILLWFHLSDFKDPRLTGEGDGTPLQYSCLENPMDGGAWWAAVHEVAKSQTGLSDFTFTFHFHALEKGMATRSSVLAWRIPGTGEPGGLPSMGSHRVGHDWSDLAATAAG